MRSPAFAINLAAALLLALPASANFDVKASITCYEGAEGTTKLGKEKGKNDAIVAACLGVAETDPSVADYSLTFDSDFRVLHVIRNCDSLEICVLSDLDACSTAYDPGDASYKLKSQCLYELIDFGEVDMFGAMLCKESESYNESNDKYHFKASCGANLEVDGQACSMKVITKKLFEESGSCPAD